MFRTRTKARNLVAKIDWRIWTGLSMLIAASSIVLLIFINMQVNEVKDDASDTSAARDKQISELQRQISRQDAKLADVGTALEGQIRQFNLCKDKSSNADGCDKPVAPKPGLIIGQEDRESPAPSLESLLIVARQAQQQYCAENRCTGRDGKTPTSEQLIAIIAPVVARYVEDYCGVRNECRGPSGADGTNGSDGQNGTNGSNGEQGAKGDPGAKGEPGPICPDGYQTASLTVDTDEGQRTILACQPTPTDPPAGG